MFLETNQYCGYLETNTQDGPDLKRLRAKRLQRLRDMMVKKDYSACLLFDPNNHRYATGSRNMFGYFLRNSSRYIFIPVEGPVVLFEYPQSFHVSTWLETIDEARPSKIVWSSISKKDLCIAKPFAQEIRELLNTCSGERRLKIGMDRCFHSLALSLEEEGLQVEDCQSHLMHTRRLKTSEEVACLKQSLATTEQAMDRMKAKIKPGVSEQELFAEFYHGVIANGGELIETRLLSSGDRTNPWFQEASSKKLQNGELVCIDTDTIGNHGYYSDFSRTFFCGSKKPNSYQKSLYALAYEQIQTNIEQIRPGLSYRELSEKAWKIPPRFQSRRYTSMIHGCGLHGEAPFIPHLDQFDLYGSQGWIEPGMVLCIESYLGEPEKQEGVKLEEEVLVTDKGVEHLSRYPFDEELLRS